MSDQERVSGSPPKRSPRKQGGSRRKSKRGRRAARDQQRSQSAALAEAVPAAGGKTINGDETDDTAELIANGEGAPPHPRRSLDAVKASDEPDRTGRRRSPLKQYAAAAPAASAEAATEAAGAVIATSLPPPPPPRSSCSRSARRARARRARAGDGTDAAAPAAAAGRCSVTEFDAASTPTAHHNCTLLAQPLGAADYVALARQGKQTSWDRPPLPTKAAARSAGGGGGVAPLSPAKRVGLFADAVDGSGRGQRRRMRRPRALCPSQPMAYAAYSDEEEEDGGSSEDSGDGSSSGYDDDAEELAASSAQRSGDDEEGRRGSSRLHQQRRRFRGAAVESARARVQLLTAAGDQCEQPLLLVSCGSSPRYPPTPLTLPLAPAAVAAAATKQQQPIAAYANLQMNNNSADRCDSAMSDYDDTSAAGRASAQRAGPTPRRLSPPASRTLGSNGDFRAPLTFGSRAYPRSEQSGGEIVVAGEGVVGSLTLSGRAFSPSLSTVSPTGGWQSESGSARKFQVSPHSSSLPQRQQCQTESNGSKTAFVDRLAAKLATDRSPGAMSWAYKVMTLLLKSAYATNEGTFHTVPPGLRRPSRSPLSSPSMQDSEQYNGAPPRQEPTVYNQTSRMREVNEASSTVPGRPTASLAPYPARSYGKSPEVLWNAKCNYSENSQTNASPEPLNISSRQQARVDALRGVWHSPRVQTTFGISPESETAGSRVFSSIQESRTTSAPTRPWASPEMACRVAQADTVASNKNASVIDRNGTNRSPTMIRAPNTVGTPEKQKPSYASPTDIPVGSHRWSERTPEHSPIAEPLRAAAIGAKALYAALNAAAAEGAVVSKNALDPDVTTAMAHSSVRGQRPRSRTPRYNSPVNAAACKQHLKGGTSVQSPVAEPLLAAAIGARALYAAATFCASEAEGASFGKSTTGLDPNRSSATVQAPTAHRRTPLDNSAVGTVTQSACKSESSSISEHLLAAAVGAKALYAAAAAALGAATEEESAFVANIAAIDQYDIGRATNGADAPFAVQPGQTIPSPKRRRTPSSPCDSIGGWPAANPCGLGTPDSDDDFEAPGPKGYETCKPTQPFSATSMAYTKPTFPQPMIGSLITRLPSGARVIGTVNALTRRELPRISTKEALGNANSLTTPPTTRGAAAIALAANAARAGSPVIDRREGMSSFLSTERQAPESNQDSTLASRTAAGVSAMASSGRTPKPQRATSYFTNETQKRQSPESSPRAASAKARFTCHTTKERQPLMSQGLWTFPRSRAFMDSRFAPAFTNYSANDFRIVDDYEVHWQMRRRAAPRSVNPDSANGTSERPLTETGERRDVQADATGQVASLEQSLYRRPEPSPISDRVKELPPTPQQISYVTGDVGICGGVDGGLARDGAPARLPAEDSRLAGFSNRQSEARTASPLDNSVASSGRDRGVGGNVGSGGGGGFETRRQRSTHVYSVNSDCEQVRLTRGVELQPSPATAASLARLDYGPPRCAALVAGSAERPTHQLSPPDEASSRGAPLRASPLNASRTSQQPSQREDSSLQPERPDVYKPPHKRDEVTAADTPKTPQRRCPRENSTSELDGRRLNCTLQDLRDNASPMRLASTQRDDSAARAPAQSSPPQPPRISATTTVDAEGALPLLRPCGSAAQSQQGLRATSPPSRGSTPPANQSASGASDNGSAGPATPLTIATRSTTRTMGTGADCERSTYESAVLQLPPEPAAATAPCGRGVSLALQETIHERTVTSGRDAQRRTGVSASAAAAPQPTAARPPDNARRSFEPQEFGCRDHEVARQPVSQPVPASLLHGQNDATAKQCQQERPTSSESAARPAAVSGAIHRPPLLAALPARYSVNADGEGVTVAAIPPAAGKSQATTADTPRRPPPESPTSQLLPTSSTSPTPPTPPTPPMPQQLVIETPRVHYSHLAAGLQSVVQQYNFVKGSVSERDYSSSDVASSPLGRVIHPSDKVDSATMTAAAVSGPPVGGIRQSAGPAAALPASSAARSAAAAATAAFATAPQLQPTPATAAGITPAAVIAKGGHLQNSGAVAGAVVPSATSSGAAAETSPPILLSNCSAKNGADPCGGCAAHAKTSAALAPTNVLNDPQQQQPQLSQPRTASQAEKAQSVQLQQPVSAQQQPSSAKPPVERAHKSRTAARFAAPSAAAVEPGQATAGTSDRSTAVGRQSSALSSGRSTPPSTAVSQKVAQEPVNSERAAHPLPLPLPPLQPSTTAAVTGTTTATTTAAVARPATPDHDSNSKR